MIRRPVAILAALIVHAAANAATFSIVNMDAVGEGFNDTTPVIPVGGNNATTLGQARLIVINEAARLWGLHLGGAVTIVVEAQFDPLTCSATSGTLGHAGPITYFTNGSGGSLPLTDVLYPAALADAISGTNINGRNDISATFNSSVGGNSNCLGGSYFYLGLDHQTAGKIDLLQVMMHELGHGLGFVSLVDAAGNSLDTAGSRLGVFDQYIYAEALGRFWPNMTSAERATSSTSNALAWNGAAVNGELSYLTAGLSSPGGHLRLYAPTTYDEGSSVSHWTALASPDLLMEPFITSNFNGLTDLTGCVFRDIGWPGARCPDTPASNNSPPTATPQSITIAEDVTQGITLRGTDPEGQALSYSIVTSPAHGTVTLLGSTVSSTGVFVLYAPASNFNGSDSFQFQVRDPFGSSSLATVNITVTPVNDAPVPMAQALLTPVNTPLNIVLSATDVDSSTLSYSLFNSPAHGTLTGTPPNLLYTPTNNYIGPDGFSFRVSDGALQSGGSINIDVGDRAPVANNVFVNTSVRAPVSFSLSASDPDGDPLTYAILYGPSFGTLTGTAPNYTYTPNGQHYGQDTIQYRVSDGKLTSFQANVVIYIDDHSPTASAQTVNAAARVATPITLVASDPDGDSLTYLIVNGPRNGTLTGTAPDLTYTPTGNFSGTDSFTFLVKARPAPLQSSLATVTINVVGNHAPVADNASFAMTTGSSVAIRLTGSDPDGDAIVYSVLSNPANGVLSGTVPTLTYTPASSFSGNDSFTFRVSDGNANSSLATVSVIVVAAPSSGASSSGSGGGSSGGGGGGAFDWTAIALLGLLAYDRTARRRTASISGSRQQRQCLHQLLTVTIRNAHRDSPGTTSGKCGPSIGAA